MGYTVSSFTYFKHGEDGSTVPSTYHSATQAYQSEPSKGLQVYEEVDPSQKDSDAVGRPIPHVSAKKQTTGEAVYIDDMPHYEG